MPEIGETFLHEYTTLRKYANRYIDDITIEVYSVGIAATKARDVISYTDIDTGIILKMKGKEVYRNLKTRPINEVVLDFQRKLLAESLGIR